MKNQKHKHVREMARTIKRTPKGREATIVLRCADNGIWGVNGDPHQDDMSAARAVLQCMEALADERDRKTGRQPPLTRQERAT
jgi:hypothetical protein